MIKTLSFLTLGLASMSTFAAPSAHQRAYQNFRNSLMNQAAFADIKSEAPPDPVDPQPLTPVRMAKAIVKFNAMTLDRKGNNFSGRSTPICEKTVDVPVYDLRNIDWSKGYYWQTEDVSCPAKLDKAGDIEAVAMLQITISPAGINSADSPQKNFQSIMWARSPKLPPSTGWFGIPGASTRDLGLQGLILTAQGVSVYKDSSPDSPDQVSTEESVGGTIEYVDEGANVQ
ncbi:MAG: hypothetical protein ABIR96_08385 [Bdellovibrionota bacterium]